jgi:DNA polymerase-3 subunit epsilon
MFTAWVARFMGGKDVAAKLAEAPKQATPTHDLPYEAAMERMRFAVLDVETTHGDPTEGRVMEVAVLVFDGGDERLRWDSLVKPRKPISPFVQRLTGIRQDMLSDAPTFFEVVRTLGTLTEDRIVVAHNVRFDMTAMEHEFARTGLVFDRPTLCTERIARQLVPGLDHYNLGSLCRHFGIPYAAAHRAMNDAEATARLLFALVDAFGHERVLQGVTGWQRALRA